ncbi:MAG: HD domain-containing protein [Candidatus Micrarchaeota archaeon]
MLSFVQAKKFLHETLKEKPNVIAHCEAVGQVAFEVAKKIEKKHPELAVDAGKARIIGLLHDVGRAVSCGPDHHLQSRTLLEEIGEVDLAKSVARHGYAFEFSKNNEDFLPHSIEEKIVDYADCSVIGDRVVGFEERVREWRERHKEKDDFDFGLACFDRKSKTIAEVQKLLE